MIGLDPRNPLVALCKSNEPHINDAAALVVALEARDMYAPGIVELGTLAQQALEILGNDSDTSLANAVAAFMVPLAAGGEIRRANAFVAVFPALHARIAEVTGRRELNPDEVRKLLQDCVAMKTGGPAAE